MTFILCAFIHTTFRNVFIDATITSFVVVTREKKVDLERKQSARCVFECRVFGQKGVGKVLNPCTVYNVTCIFVIHVTFVC